MSLHIFAACCLLLPIASYADTRSGQQISSDFPVTKLWIDVKTAEITPGMFREVKGESKFAGAPAIGRDGHFTFVCRGVVDNNLIPGTYDRFERTCIVERFGEKRLETFQVLPNTNSGQTWWYDASGNKVPPHPLVAGFEDNTPLFICRVKVNGHHWVIGKFNTQQGACWVTENGKPVARTTYSILNVPNPAFEIETESGARALRSPSHGINWPVLNDLIGKGDFTASDVDLIGLAAGLDLQEEAVIKADGSIDATKLEQLLTPKLKQKSVSDTLTRRAKTNTNLRKILDLDAKVGS